jgi:hypothetical protein
MRGRVVERKSGLASPLASRRRLSRAVAPSNRARRDQTGSSPIEYSSHKPFAKEFATQRFSALDQNQDRPLTSRPIWGPGGTSSAISHAASSIPRQVKPEVRDKLDQAHMTERVLSRSGGFVPLADALLRQAGGAISEPEIEGSLPRAGFMQG